MIDLAGATFVQDLAVGFAELVAAADVGFTWAPSGQYDADQVGIFVADVPDVPDRILVVTPYPLADPVPGLSNATWGVQFRYRGRPGAGWADVAAMSTVIRSLLRGQFVNAGRLPNGQWISMLAWANGGSLGQGERRRWSWQDSFTCQALEPGTFTR